MYSLSETFISTPKLENKLVYNYIFYGAQLFFITHFQYFIVAKTFYRCDERPTQREEANEPKQ